MIGFINSYRDKKFKLIFFIGLIVLSNFIWGCGGGGGDSSGANSAASQYSYQVPEQIDDGWTTADLRNTSADVQALETMVRSIKQDNTGNINSVLIILDGKLVLEEYFPGYQFIWNNFNSVPVNYNRETLHHLASATKSFASALIGIAIDQGKISGVDKSLFELFPQYGYLNNVDKAKITLGNTLTMTAGLQWDEHTAPYTSLQNDAVAISLSNDWYAFVLARNAVLTPGVYFNYSSGLSILLGGIITNVSGSTADVFAENYLFGPLNIDTYQWDKGPKGEIQTGGGLWLRPRDMAKFGQLFLNKGVWNGSRVISEAWVNQSTAKHVILNTGGSYPRQTGYGYQWWRIAFQANGHVYEAYYALGWGGQNIVVFEDLNMVVVFTSGDYVGPYGGARGIIYINDVILPAIL